MKNEAPGWFGPVAALIIAIGTAVGSNFLDPIVHNTFPNWSPPVAQATASVLAAFTFGLPLYVLVRWRRWTK